jgi:hypothetical protein
MKGKLTKDKIKLMVQPLVALDKVLSNSVDKVHIIYEEGFADNDSLDGSLFIRARDAGGNVFAMYKFDEPQNILEGYNKTADKIGIWNVGEFVSILSSFDSGVNVEFVKEKNYYVLSSGNRKITFKTADCAEIKEGKKRLKMDKVTPSVQFTMNKDVVNHLKADISLFAVQDTIVLTGKQGTNAINIKIVKLGEERAQHSYENTLDGEGIKVNADFEISFPKDTIQNILSCNDNFTATFYTGTKSIGEFTYERDGYSMKFYVSPKVTVTE